MSVMLKRKQVGFRPHHAFVSQAKLMRVVHKLTFVNRKRDKEVYCLSIRKRLESEGHGHWKIAGSEIVNDQGRVMATIESHRMPDRAIKAMRLV